ncbi:hypothetical protein [Streptomyces guryensis]|uniref:Uncharacterized protein n=1 Tax=Streptomyces guryensis TaxID=2886947 RepID=A0A9Q3VY54_9ACTN|nr:hypothetical protein [Streptomyces guryensis]MCD9880312.1 hypothetical protein [Streptomyces guryensis]
MLLLSALREAVGLTVGSLVTARLGMLGLLLLSTLAMGIRARHQGVAVGAAVMLVVLMAQA